MTLKHLNVIKKQPPKQTHSGSARFLFAASEDNSTFTCKLDKHGWKHCDAKYELEHLDAGDHKLAVRAIVTPASASLTLPGRPVRALARAAAVAASTCTCTTNGCAPAARAAAIVLARCVGVGKLPSSSTMRSPFAVCAAARASTSAYVRAENSSV